MHLNPVIPATLIYVIGSLVLLLTAGLYWREARRLSAGKNLTLLVFRLLALALIVLLLLQPSRREKIRHSLRPGVVLIAVDTSRSMAHADDQETSRLERAREILAEAGLDENRDAGEALRFYRFDESVTSLTGEQLATTVADGSDTLFHSSIESVVDDAKANGLDVDAMLILSDGHDFELAGIQRTARIARFGRFPIYTVAVGSSGRVRDISARIGNFQPYAYVGQEATISAILRVIGVDYETLTVQLLRDGELADSQRVAIGEESEINVRFKVSEDRPGQYPYEIRVLPVENETDPSNNSAVTYLNVIDEKMRALILEGSPYWDTTFLQRSLYRNDKIELDAITAVQDSHNLARLRNDPDRGEVPVPSDSGDFAPYDVIILGRDIDRIVDLDSCAEHLRSYVEDFGGTLVFARGHPLGSDAEAGTKSLDAIAALEPLVWENAGNDGLALEVVGDGRALAAFRTLAERQRSSQPLPPLIAGRRVKSAKPLTAVLAEAHDADTGQRFPAIVHRRVGRGQVFSVGVSGLWRWGFDAAAKESDTAANTFDQFWDQTLVWLLSQSDNIPSQSFSFRASTANLALGEKITLRLVRRDTADEGTAGAGADTAAAPLAEIYFGDNNRGERLATVQLTSNEKGPDNAFAGEFVPERPGRYHAEIALPGGASAQLRFMVYDEQPEITEVATDVAYLRKLAVSTGGQLLRGDELEKLFGRMVTSEEESDPQYELIPIWNQPWIFYLIVALLGTDWYLRRRWGLT